ncbi:hypothetical protein JVT61DRAFT_13191 [Boletus reticuloceps]|uniref:Kinase n=1 Tax=Boletus reticuloceps TaxID=495285 RepID=A0A8I2YYM5_9AGAM|nr:hypothetical protein JVT61DRAFT_13191 [Boletus reticuloceps]
MIPIRPLPAPAPSHHPLTFCLPPSPDTTAPSSPREQTPLHDTPHRSRDQTPSRTPHPHSKHHHTRFSASSSSSSSGHCPSPLLQTAGIGRKVAESLQLFKESEERPPNYETALTKRRFTTSHLNDGVEEAKYEFVKRADWPDPETAALRRERSSTALENYVSRQDTIIRGRRRRRTSDISIIDPQPTSPEPYVPPSPCIRPHSRAYPPSPSPSRSPTDRIPPLALYAPAIDPVTTTDDPQLPELSVVLTNFNRSHSRSPTPTHISPHASPIVSPPTMLPSPTRSFSPWSTDDESAWETSSMTSDISTPSGTSEHSLSYPQVQDPSIDPANKGEKIRASLHKSEDDANSYGSDLWNADSLNMVYGDSEESLPHIPLRPFRNQVGGHSAIYKFTKRAVCKPLVSRENQFYEAVEREAPPLLDFIPRYLGVMLVTYRRVFKGSTTPPSPQPSASFPVGVSHFSGSVVQRAISEPDYSFGDVPFESGMTFEEAELPEVALDRNRHIIPKWLLHRGHLHDRTYSHIQSLGRLGSRQRLRSTQLSAATASSPALIQNQDAVQPSLKQLPLSRQSTMPLDHFDPCNAGNTVRAAASFADPRSAWGIVTSGKSQASRPDLRPFRSESAIGSQQSSPTWFRGTGSTTVNTKLKDHIFSTILRRFHRRGNLRWLNGLHTEDEREASSRQEKALSASPQPRSKQYAGPYRAVQRTGE